MGPFKFSSFLDKRTFILQFPRSFSFNYKMNTVILYLLVFKQILISVEFNFYLLVEMLTWSTNGKVIILFKADNQVVNSMKLK